MTSQVTATPPAGFGVLLLLARTAFRRKYNHYTAGLKGMWRRKKTAPAAKRQATPRKRVGSLLLGVYLAVVMVFSISNLTAMAFRNAKAVVSSPATELPDQWTQIKDLATEVASDKKYVPTESWEDVKKQVKGQAEDIRKLLPWPSPALAPAPEHWPAFLQLQAVFLCLMAATIWLSGLAGAKQELGHGGWSLEWLATFPVPVGTLLLARVGEYALTDGYLWLVLGPYLLGLFIVAGKGWSALPLALACTLLIGIGLAAVRVFAETALRKRLATHALKNVQAVCALVGLVGYFGCLACLLAPWLLRVLFVWSRQLPAFVGWLPPALPATACAPGGLWPSLAGLTLATGLVSGVCVWWSGRLLRSGLVANTGTFAGKRGKAKHASSPGPAGVAGKDLRLLRRDRTVLVQTLVVPLMIAGFQAVMNPGGARAILTNPNHLAAVAFGLGAYMLCFSAIHALTWEGPGLWFLYTFPERLDRMLLRKVALWAVVALGYTGAIFAAGVWHHGGLNAALIAGGALAMVGVVLHAFIAAGIGILGADPLQPDIRHRLNPSYMLVYMLLAALFAHAMYTPSAWAKLAQVVLSALLAFALWQKVRDHLPYLLDPVSAPPPRISLADGLLGVVSFFALQNILFLVLTLAVEMPPGQALFIGFAGAGLLVALGTLYAYWRQGMPDLLAQVGLRRDMAGTGQAWPAALGTGLLGAVLAAAGAALYFQIVPLVPGLSALARETLLAAEDGDGAFRWWIAVLAVVAAPLAEEYIFRGLVYRGLRRSLRPVLAIVAAAAVFAIVHPPFSVLPVFGLGLVCAWAFERSRTLLAPAVVHAGYNALVILVLTPAFLSQIPQPPPPAPPQVLNDAALPAQSAKDELSLPGQSLAQGNKFPLLVVLHAGGGSPREALKPLRDLVKSWQYALYAPCGSVRSATGGGWNREPGYDWNAARDLDRVAAQVREWLAQYPIENGGVYLVGHGTGANMAYLLGIRHPDLFAGVIAVGGRIQPELLDAAQIARAAPRLPIYIVHDLQDRSLTPAIRSERLEFFKTHLFPTRTVEYPRLPGSADLLRACINSINADRAELLKTLTEETPQQAAVRMRQEVPQSMAVESNGRFVIASDAPQPVRQRLAQDFAAIQRRCAALIGRGDLDRGSAIRVYYPKTQDEMASLYRKLMGRDMTGLHGYHSWFPTRAWGSADVGTGTLAHELVHVFVMSDWPQIPGWLNESLAVALGCPKVGFRTESGFATDDLWLDTGRQALARNRWTPVSAVFACEGPDYASLDTVDLEIAPGTTLKIGPLLTGRLLVRMLNETGRLDRFYRGWREGNGAAGALQAIGTGDAEALDRELRAWLAPPASPGSQGR